jgi:hypothetical protein
MRSGGEGVLSGPATEKGGISKKRRKRQRFRFSIDKKIFFRFFSKNAKKQLTNMKVFSIIIKLF